MVVYRLSVELVQGSIKVHFGFLKGSTRIL